MFWLLPLPIQIYMKSVAVFLSYLAMFKQILKLYHCCSVSRPATNQKRGSTLGSQWPLGWNRQNVVVSIVSEAFTMIMAQSWPWDSQIAVKYMSLVLKQHGAAIFQKCEDKSSAMENFGEKFWVVANTWQKVMFSSSIKDIVRFFSMFH